jgi:hypothetical protein
MFTLVVTNTPGTPSGVGIDDGESSALFVRGVPHVAFVKQSNGYHEDFYSENAGTLILPAIREIMDEFRGSDVLEVSALVAHCFTSTLPPLATLERVLPNGGSGVFGVYDPIEFIQAHTCVRVTIPARVVDE